MITLFLFDVDGTLVTTKSGKEFRQSAADWQWIPGRLEKLRTLQFQGKRIGIATNQGGVAFGYLEQWYVSAELRRLANDVPFPHAMIAACYDHPKATIAIYRKDSQRRKPNPGMLLELMGFADAKPEETVYVGDRPEDEQAAKNAGVQFMWAKDFFEDE